MSKEQQLGVLLSRGQRKVVAELLPQFAERLKLDAKNPRKIAFTSDELETIQQQAKHAIERTASGIERSFLRHVLHETGKALKESEGIGSIPASGRLYQFKITLVDSAPPIWRRIQVKDCTLDRLHERIQTAMGWTDSHLHQFKIDGERYGNPDLLGEAYQEYDYLDSTETKISQIVPRSGKRFRFLYEYDFGDCWMHDVLFEGCLAAEKGTRYPLCLEGECACPPEDIGGIWGYFDFLKSLSAWQHDAAEPGTKRFDPHEFDAQKRTNAMQRSS